MKTLKDNILKEASASEEVRDALQRLFPDVFYAVDIAGHPIQIFDTCGHTLINSSCDSEFNIHEFSLNNFLFDWKISEDSINGRITLKPIRKPEA